MKHLLIAATALIFFTNTHSQNVGINTTTPQTTLDVRGNQRFGGITKFLAYDSTSGKFEWRNSYLFVPTAQYLIQHSASAEGLYYSNSQLEYRNQLGDPVFFTNCNNGSGYFSGKVGIGKSSPGFPLSFPDTYGDKISLSEFGPSNHFGFGIQERLLQIFSGGNNTDIVFGHGSSTNFTELVRFRGNGTVGIGTSSPATRLDILGLNQWDLSNTEGDMRIGNSSYRLKFGIALDGNGAGAAGIMQYGQPGGFNGLLLGSQGNNMIMIDGNSQRVGIGNTNPGYVLDINGRSRIRSGGSNATSAGVWLNNNSNSVAAFVGMEDDTHVGFFGTSAGWKLTMNTQTGALKVNGSEGQPGQHIISNGSGQTASWTSGHFYFQQTPGSSLGILYIASQDIPGLTARPFTLTFNANLLITIMSEAKTYSNPECDISFYPNVVRSGGMNFGKAYGLYARGNKENQITFSYILPNMLAGNYTFYLSARKEFNVGGNCDIENTKVIIEVLPL